MELLILNTNLVVIDVLDTFESLIWTERYDGYGDFEIYTKVSDDILNVLQLDNYIYSIDSDYVMVIEDRQINFDIEDGHRLLIKGRSVESILDRRIIWSQTILSGSLQNGIKKLLDENLISPLIAERTIPNIIFELSTDTVITSLTVDAQFTRTNLYESIKKLCLANDIGFKMTLSDTLDQFIFKLYSGVNRSYDQIQNSYVVFSNDFENLISSEYVESQILLKTLTVSAGDGEGDARITKIVGGGTGLSRREMYTDARDLSQTVDGTPIPEEEYLSQLERRGIEDLLENGFERSFNGQVDITRMFKYREDFFMGDIVQLASDYNIESRVRITEMIRSQSLSGVDIYPTFKIID
jgi:hypothetical protein